MVAVLVVCVVTIAAGRDSGGTPTNASRGAALAGLVAAVLAAVPVFLLAWDDSGLGFALAVTGLPVVLAAAGSLASRSRRASGVLGGWLCLLLLFAYVLVFGLGVGLFFAPSALLLLASMLLRHGPQVASRP